MKRKKNSHNESIKKKVYAIVAIVAVVISGWFCWYSWNLYQQKKETEAKISNAPFAASMTREEGLIAFQGDTYERRPTVKAILCIGVDSSGTMEKKVTGAGGQADGIFLIAHDVAADRVKILMIPRDTMTPITLTDLSGNVLGKDVQHITLAYGYGDGRELSCEWLAEAVSELLSGLKIDGYLAMNTSMISTLNDMVDGVTVRVPVDGMERIDPSFVKGAEVTLYGKQAERFVRFRDSAVDNSAITRMSQQKQYMEGFFTAVKQKAARDDRAITEIMNVIERDMVTNMPKDQYMDMGLSVLGSQESLSGDDILTIPGEAVTTERFDEFHHDPEGTLETVLDLFYRKR